MEYARPSSVEEALELLALPGARPFGGGTDLAGQIDRELASPAVVVDLQELPLRGIDRAGGGVAIGATATLAELVSSDLLGSYGVVTTAASLAASAPIRNVGTVGGNICQWTRCWYFRGPEWNCWLAGGAGCYAQVGEHRKHNLQPGLCISAHPSDLAPALASCRARLTIRSAAGERELELPDLYRLPSFDNRSLLTLAHGELVTAVTLQAPPAASAYERLGERAAFSFPLLSVAAARHTDETVVVFAAGVANIPLRLDPADPLRDLPGNPQTGWKRTALATLVERAVARLDD